MQGFAQRLKQQRQERELSQEGLGSLVGTSGMQISHYECERHMPSLEMLRDLAKALRCTSDYLLGLTDKP